jgi:rod shape-determining protein MreC
VILVLLVITAVVLVVLDVRGGAQFAGLRSAAGTVFAPIESTVGVVVHPVGSFFSRLGTGSSGKAEALREKNAALRHKLAATAGMRRELGQLRSLTHLAGQGRFRIVAAHVIAIGSAGASEWSATIDVGSADGVHRDMTVMCGDGLVGKTKRVGMHTSTVLLAIDPESHVGARMEGSGEAGYITGKGLSGVSLTLLDSNVKLHRGERLVTLGPGHGRPYVAELPIGTVTKVESTPGSLTRTATVRPFANFTSLDAVGVVLNRPSVPRDSLLPKKPKSKHTGKDKDRGEPESEHGKGKRGASSTKPDQQRSPAGGAKP